MLDIAAICLVITALLAWLNHRFIGIPTTIGVMAAAMVFSLALVGLDALGIAHDLRQYEESLLRSIDFSDVVMKGMLSLLLFAGALHVDLSELKAYRWPIGGLALLGTVLSTLVVGFAMWFVLPLIGTISWFFRIRNAINGWWQASAGVTYPGLANRHVDNVPLSGLVAPVRSDVRS